MNILKMIDLYGINFNFKINNADKLKTFIGGLLTIFTIIVSVLISFFLGKDFYLRTNPLFIYQIMFDDNFPKWELKNNNSLTIAYRLEDDDGQEIEFNNTIFPKLYYNFWKHTGDGIFKRKYIKKFSLKKCNEFNIDLGKNFSYDKWYCLDFSEFDDLILTGNYNFRDDIGEISLHLDTCSYDDEIEGKNNREGKIIPKEKGICNNNLDRFKQFFKRFNYKIFMNIMMPKIYIQPDDIKNPLKNSYFFYFKKIDYLMNTEDFIYLNKMTLNDDKGWIFPSNETDKYITFKEARQNFMTIRPEDYKEEKLENINILTLNILMTRLEELFKRKYMKIQDVFAISGGFISFFKIFFTFINFYFCQEKINKILLNNCFNNFYNIDENLLRHFQIDKRLIHFKNQSNNKISNSNSNISQIEKNPNHKLKNIQKLYLLKYKINNMRILRERNTIINNSNNFDEKSFVNEKINQIDLNKNNFFDLTKNDQNDQYEMNEINRNYKNIEDNSYLTKLNLREDEFDKGNITSERKLRDFDKNINLKENFDVSLKKISDIGIIENLNILKENFQIFRKLKNLSNYSEVSIYKNILGIFCKNKKNEKVNSIYEISMKKMSKKIEILNYFKLMKNIKVIKKLILKDEQRYFLKYYYGKNIKIQQVNLQNKDRNKLENKNNLMIKYYNDILTNNFDDCNIVDREILKDFSENITNNFVNNKFSNI